jgi:hypothetical protein
MTPTEAAHKLLMLSGAIEEKYNQVEIKTIVEEASFKVNVIVGDFLYNELYKLFLLDQLKEENNNIIEMVTELVVIIDYVNSIPDDIENRKLRNSVLFKSELLFNKVSDHFKSNYAYSASSEKYENILNLARSLQARSLTQYLLKGFFPNEDIEKIIGDINKM